MEHGLLMDLKTNRTASQGSTVVVENRQADREWGKVVGRMLIVNNKYLTCKKQKLEATDLPQVGTETRLIFFSHSRLTLQI